MPVSHGFLSYVHADNRVEGNRIADLAQDVADQYGLLTTEEFRLFRDKDHLEWGEDWRLRIDEALAQATFFIAVITPAYFQRPECRRELDSFARRAVELGVKDLVLPIVYVDFPALRADPCEDELIALVRKFGWEDWTTLRFTDRESAEYRRAVARLAQRLATASAETERVPLPTPEDDAPGYLDVLATTEETLPRWLKTLDMINAKLTELGVIMQRAGELDLRGFGDRVAVGNVLAVALAAPVADLQGLSNEFVVQLHEMDQGVRVVVEHAQRHTAGNPDLTDPIAEFTRDLRARIDEEVTELAEAEDLIAIIEEIEQITRTLRPVARSLRKSLTLLADGRDLMTTWSFMLDQLPPPLDGRRG